VFTGAAIGLGLEAVSVRDDFVTNGRLDGDARDQAVTLRALTNVAWGAAILSAGVGAVLLFTAKRDARPARSAVTFAGH
jgi:hypothetical protein